LIAARACLMGARGIFGSYFCGVYCMVADST
jgi:hypothetical protein